MAFWIQTYCNGAVYKIFEVGVYWATLRIFETIEGTAIRTELFKFNVYM